MTGAFYDRVERQAAAQPPSSQRLYAQDIDGPEPEERYGALVVETVRRGDTVLDVGTGDASWFIDNVAPTAALAIGFDTGLLRLRQGIVHKRQNVVLLLADAQSIPLPDATVDVVLSRRSPVSESLSTLREGLRVVRPGGYVIEIDIGEQNCREVTEVFGHSQMSFEVTLGSRLQRMVAAHDSEGLHTVVAEDYETFEYFHGRDHLEQRLITAPILVEFDRETHASLVDDLVARNQTPRGIRITYHRFVLMTRKL